jgi:hypothetical protein
MRFARPTAIFVCIPMALMTVFLLGGRIPVFADAGAYGSAMGGIQFRKESRISMEKERLTIGKWKVTAEYAFLNDTAKDITIGLAFPLPDAVCNTGYALGKSTILNSSASFHVWADGKELQYSTEIKALDRDGHSEYTNFVQGVGADVASCSIPATLSHEDGQKLVASGLAYFVLDDPAAAVMPQWTIREKYYWTETFPAHRTVSLKNEYTPFSGWWEVLVDKDSGLGAVTEDSSADRRDACFGPRLLKKLSVFRFNENTAYIRFGFVDYILTTATYWNGPIKDFELIIEKPPGVTVSMCWKGPVEKMDKSHFRATAHNFTPTQNLKIGFSYPY